MSDLTIPFGENQGESIDTCSLEALDWAINAIDNKLRTKAPDRYTERNRAWLREALAVFAARTESTDGVLTSAAPIVPAAEALAKLTTSAIRDAKAATELLAEARELGHLVSPAPAVGVIPEGFSIMVSGLLVDIQRETYQHSGSSERGLGKVAIDRIGGAAGVDWDPEKSRRLDDNSHPHYRCCQAVGRVRNFDGSWRHLEDKKEIDLREGSARIQAILTREAEKKRKEGDKYRGDGGQREIAMQRLHILSLCTTEARLRATRILGLRTAYTPKELERPFIIVQLAFDGRSANPETAAYFRQRIADSALGASSALYGAPSAPASLPAREVRTIELPEADDSGIPDLVVPKRRTGTYGRKY